MIAKSLSKNSLNLIIYNAIALFIPILLVPIMSSGYGIDSVGYFLFFLAVINLLSLFCDLGLSTYGIKKYNEVQNEEELHVFYLASIFIKFILHVSVLLLAMLFYALLDNEKFTVLFISIIASYFFAITPIWAVQARQQFFLLVIFQVFTKLSLIPIVVLFIELELGFLNVLFVYIFLLLIGCIFLQRKLMFPTKIFPNFQYFYHAKRFLKEIKPFFMNRVASSILVYSPSVVLGSFLSPGVFAIYGVAEYFYKAMMALTQIGNQATYPYISKNRSKRYFIISFLTFLIGNLLIVTLGLCFNEEIILMVFGSKFTQSSFLVPFFLLFGILSFLNIFLGFPLAALLKNFKPVNASSILVCFVYLSAVLILISYDSVNARMIIFTLIVCETLSILIRGSIFFSFARKAWYLK